MAIPEEVYDSARLPHPLIEEFLALIKYKELVIQFVSRALKTRYKRSVLGIAWTMLNPLLTMVVLTLVFSQVFKISIEHYPVYVLSGLMAWNFFSGTTRQAMADMVFSGYLFNRIYVPKTVFAVSSVGTGLVNFVLSLIPLLLIAIIVGVRLNLAILMIPLATLLLALFSLGLGLILATAAVYFADMLPVFDVILTIWMYATPIIYPLDVVPAQWAWVFRLNPLYYLVEVFRQPLFSGSLPPLQMWGIATVCALGTFAAGGLIFTSKSNEYAYRI